MDKKSLRKQLREQRKNCSPLFIQQANQKIYSKALPYIEKKQYIGIYASDGFEVDTYKMIEWCLKQGKVVALPLIKDHQTMEFMTIQSVKDLKVAHFGLLEPSGGKLISKDLMDCMFIPVVGFNSRNYRIGQGGGYYDRYLKNFQGLKIGLAYDFQYCEFKEDDFDIACDLILTQ